jgi:hypothetical protein
VTHRTPSPSQPIPFAWLDIHGAAIVLSIDGPELLIAAPDWVRVSATPHGKLDARKQEVDEHWPVIGAEVFVSRCGRCQRIVVETNQMDLCKGDIEQAIVEWLARRKESEE